MRRIKSAMKESSNNNNFSPRRLNVLALLALLLAAGGGNALRAQDADPCEQTPEARREQQARRGAGGGGGLLRVLNLSPEQRAQIKAIRRETEPQGRLLGVRLRQARRALDEAVYADNPDDALIEARVREAGAAQTALLRMRTLTELKIRRVLTPEQLEAFRRMQRRPRQQRMNQTTPPGDFPDDADFAPSPRRNRTRRRL